MRRVVAVVLMGSVLVTLFVVRSPGASAAVRTCFYEERKVSKLQFCSDLAPESIPKIGEFIQYTRRDSGRRQESVVRYVLHDFDGSHVLRFVEVTLDPQQFV